VASFLEGQSYHLYYRTRLNDVRLVYAPPRSVGEFGGEVDNWEWRGNASYEILEDLSNPLDIWIVSRMNQLHTEVEEHMDKYDLPNATRPILDFVDDASNWYVRRSRKRFWKTDNDSDKDDAYKTLHWVLLRLSVLMAPFTPFLAEELFLKLTNGDSVHLLDWPKAGNVNEKLVEEMSAVRSVISDGLALRSQNQLKVRQPLASVTVTPTQLILIEPFYYIFK
jgi:isoleucyl-tRNA synthetase